LIDHWYERIYNAVVYNLAIFHAVSARNKNSFISSII
jgi:hypothetical protein